MKVKIEKCDLTHDVLVYLFSTALYGNNNLGCDYNRDEYREFCDCDENDCYEDKIAKLLLAGRSVEISDCYSEDEEDVYGNNKRVYWDAELQIMVYPITLDDIVVGLEKAATDGYSKHVFDLLKEDGDMDMIGADTLLQYICFGEAIYG